MLLGISLGSLMSRQLLQHVSAYPLTIGLLALATFCTTLGSSYYLQRLHGWDRTSAFLAASPGALSQITMLAIEKGADMPAIAVVQTHAGDHPHRRFAADAGADRIDVVFRAGADDDGRLSARAGRPDRRVGGGFAGVQDGEIPGELDVRRHDRLKRAAWRRTDRRRPAAAGAEHRADRHRHADRLALLRG